ncbi:hypothetical protein PROFUN_00026 [Planoprotostelium fungivorum]|uniref:small monomeric GTPase n=1 Tax=Planoprotostelium fungivorum TaxID=1890364 RepID=A0A2P6P0F4_9EUKA|nr:hypothetical protein PROFUN_00026 [Planoprotostelium fungivorum]
MSSNFKQVVLGGGAVGKSSITMMFLQNKFISEYDPTIEEAYRKSLVVDDEAVTLDILDTAGQEEYSSLREQYIRTGDCFFLVYSIASKESFKECNLFRDKIYQTQDRNLADCNSPESQIIPMVLIGNKCDLEEMRVVPTLEGRELAKQWGIPFFETSAKEKINIDECFYELIRLARRYRRANSGEAGTHLLHENYCNERSATSSLSEINGRGTKEYSSTFCVSLAYCTLCKPCLFTSLLVAMGVQRKIS